MPPPPSPRMIPLQDQLLFEKLYKDSTLLDPVLVYFTADWCGACKKLNWEFLLKEFPNLTIYVSDVDKNTYTHGFCGLRSIPSFVMIPRGIENIPKKLDTLISSDTSKVAVWIKKNLLL